MPRKEETVETYVASGIASPTVGQDGRALETVKRNEKPLKLETSNKT